MFCLLGEEGENGISKGEDIRGLKGGELEIGFDEGGYVFTKKEGCSYESLKGEGGARRFCDGVEDCLCLGVLLGLEGTFSLEKALL